MLFVYPVLVLPFFFILESVEIRVAKTSLASIQETSLVLQQNHSLDGLSKSEFYKTHRTPLKRGRCYTFLITGGPKAGSKKKKASQ